MVVGHSTVHSPLFPVIVSSRETVQNKVAVMVWNAAVGVCEDDARTDYAGFAESAVPRTVAAVVG